MIQFSDTDFLCFAPQYQRNREYNKKRLAIRRKLQTAGEEILPLLSKSEVSFSVRTSLHHPFIYNRYSVSSQWVYFSPTKADLAPLKQMLGEAFSEELDQHYTHVMLLLGIDFEGIFISLKIPDKAWWDAQNLKNKCASIEMRLKFLECLHKAPRFFLGIHDWKKRYPSQSMNKSDVSEFCEYFVPGKHWLHMDCLIPKNDSLINSEQFIKTTGELLQSLVELYRFILWSPQNNFLFKK